MLPGQPTGNKIVTARVGRPAPGTTQTTRRCGGYERECAMIVLGVLLLLLGVLIGPSILVTLGIILLVVGLVLNFVPLGGTRRRFY